MGLVREVGHPERESRELSIVDTWCYNLRFPWWRLDVHLDTEDYGKKVLSELSSRWTI